MESRISELIYKTITGDIIDSERAELEQLVGDSPHLRSLTEQLTDPVSLRRDYEAMRIIDPARPCADMQSRVDRMRSRTLRRCVLEVAACVAVLAGLCLWFFRSPSDMAVEVPSDVAAVMDINDIKPGKTMAILSNPDGKQVRLSAEDSGMESDELFVDGAADGTAYGVNPEQLCLDVPRGGEFKIVLEDSTEVWLNSESQLRYPSTFGPDERRVEIVGEAYFAVRKDTERPFYVESGGQIIRVYGTTFNIRAYPDEDNSYTTLESGSIALFPSAGDGGEVRMSPSHQAVFDHSDNKVYMRVVNPEVITGWRYGRFVFEEQPLEAIMRDLSRWYNFEYEFSDDSLRTRVFMGSTPRYADFRTAIQILENCGDIRFTVTADNKILISPSRQSS
ncbi:MAG: DUF4974 domain-containing protein [Bacteroides sp.]|nr:DUF4974 domain-containing protein [Bacteroides sp.]